MLELLDSLTNENLILICFILGILALCLAIGISIEMYTTNKKYKALEKSKEKLSIENTQSKLNIKESANVRYVDENSELEKTKAKMELEKLREKLKLEEEEKQKAIEEKIRLEREKEKLEQVAPNNEELEKTIVNLKPVVIERKEVEDTPQVEELEKTKEIDVASIVSKDIPSDEDDAIISYDELKNAKSFGYTDEEMYNNVDEEDAIISVQELEKLYNESQSIDVSYEPKVEAVNDSNINSSPYDSSIYNMTKTDQDLVLEQTANLEKLNEEIRKTNEFLKMLKDLKKNLD